MNDKPNTYLRPDVLARISRVGLRARRVVEGTISGMHRSPLHGVSVEFADYREYAPGDDLKRLDWRVYGRSDRYFIKRFEEESNLRATILLDASGSMRYGEGAARKYDYAATAAACLTGLFIRQRDAVGLIAFDEGVRTTLRPAATRVQLSKVLDTLAATTPGGETELGAVIAEAADRVHKRGLVVLISDLLGDLPALYKALGKLQAGGHEVILLHVLHADELELPFNDSVIFHDLEGSEELFAEPWAFRKAYQQEMFRFTEDVRRHCRFCGMDYLLLRTDRDPGLTLSEYLHERLNRPPLKHQGTMAALAPVKEESGS